LAEFGRVEEEAIRPGASVKGNAPSLERSNAISDRAGGRVFGAGILQKKWGASWEKFWHSLLGYDFCADREEKAVGQTIF